MSKQRSSCHTTHTRSRNQRRVLPLSAARIAIVAETPRGNPCMRRPLWRPALCGSERVPCSFEGYGTALDTLSTGILREGGGTLCAASRPGSLINICTTGS